MFQRHRQPARSVAAAAVLSILAAVAWAALIFGDDGQERRQLVVLGEDYQDGRLEQLIDAGPKWEKTPQSADWPETRNPLKDFDSDFAGPEKVRIQALFLHAGADHGYHTDESCKSRTLPCQSIPTVFACSLVWYWLALFAAAIVENSFAATIPCDLCTNRSRT